MLFLQYQNKTMYQKQLLEELNLLKENDKPLFPQDVQRYEEEQAELNFLFLQLLHHLSVRDI